MLKNTAKYALITSLIIIVQLLVVLFIASDYSSLYEWMENPVLWQLLALPLALLLVSAAIGFSIALLTRKKKDVTTDDSQLVKQKKAQLFWLSQLFASLLFSLIVVGFAIPAGTQVYFSSNSHDTAIIIMLMLSGVLVTSLIVAALVVAAAGTWQTNKATSYILGVTCAIPLSIVVLCSFMLYSHATKEDYVENSSESYYNEGSNEAYAENAEEEEYYETEENDAEALLSDKESDAMSNVIKYFIHSRMSLDDEESDATYNLQHWWWYLFDSEDLTQSQLSYFYDSDQWDSKQTFLQAAQDFSSIQAYLTGNADGLMDAFQRYFPKIKRSFPKSSYRNSTAAVFVKCLLATHDDLYADSNTSADKLQAIYNVMVENEMEEDVTEYYDLILPYINDVISERNLLSSDSDNDWLVQQVSVWAYSFWARRYQDETDEAALSILNMISDYYEPN